MSSDAEDSVRESIDVTGGVVDGERRPDCGIEAKPAQRGLGAVVPGANRNSLLIQEFADLFGLSVGQYEGEDTNFVACLPDESEARNFEQSCCSVFKQFMFMAEDGGPAECEEVFDGCLQSDGICDTGRTGFKFCGWFAPGGFFEGHGADHVTSALPGWHHLLQFAACIESSDAGWGEDFVA